MTTFTFTPEGHNDLPQKQILLTSEEIEALVMALQFYETARQRLTPERPPVILHTSILAKIEAAKK